MDPHYRLIRTRQIQYGFVYILQLRFLAINVSSLIGEFEFFLGNVYPFLRIDLF